MVSSSSAYSVLCTDFRMYFYKEIQSNCPQCEEARKADKLIIILKSSCHFSNISENVHPESTIPKLESKTALDSIETASTYSPVAPLVKKVH